MIETLTPPVKGSPVSPGARATAGAAGGIDFAALFGTAGAGVADSAAPTGDAIVAAVPSVPTPAAGAIPTADPSLTEPVPAIAATTDTTGVATTALTAAPVTPQVDPAALVTVPVAVDPAVPIADSDAPDTSAALPGLKLPAIRPHGPVVVDDDESVKLPTLPPGFIAQKAPKLPVAGEDAGSDGQDDETADAEPTVAALPPPAQPLICAAMPVQNAPTPAVAATLISDAPGVRPGATPAKTEKLVLAEKSDEGVAADATAPIITTDATPTSPLAAVPTTHSATADTTASAPSPVIAPMLPTGTLAPQVAPAPAASVDTQQSVALDDLMVAGAGDSAWLDRVASDISTLAKGDAREAHMKINPRSLGDMSIRLDMDGSRTRVHFTVDTVQAQAMIADAAPKLTSLVQANGLKLDGATVDLNQQRRDGQSGQAQQQQQSDTPTPFNRTTSEAARLAGRTRLVTRTDRFA